MFKNKVLLASSLLITPIAILPSISCSQNSTTPSITNLLEDKYISDQNYFKTDVDDSGFVPVLQNYYEPHLILQNPNFSLSNLGISIEINEEGKQKIFAALDEASQLSDRQDILKKSFDFSSYFSITNGSIWKCSLSPHQTLTNPFTNEPSIFIEIYYRSTFITIYELKLSQIDPSFSNPSWKITNSTPAQLYQFDLPKDYFDSLTNYPDSFEADLAWYQNYSTNLFKNILKSVKNNSTYFGFSNSNAILPPILLDSNSLFAQFGMNNNQTFNFSSGKNQLVPKLDLYANYWIIGQNFDYFLNQYYQEWLNHIIAIKTEIPQIIHSNDDLAKQKIINLLSSKIRYRFSALSQVWSQFQQYSILKSFSASPSIKGFKADLTNTTTEAFNQKPLSSKINQIIFPESSSATINLELGKLMILLGAYYPSNTTADEFLKVTTDATGALTTTPFNWPFSQNIVFTTPSNNFYLKQSKILISKNNINSQPLESELNFQSKFGYDFSPTLFVTTELKS